MLSIQEIAKAIRATRADFNTLFIQAQIAENLPAADRKQFEAVVTSADDEQAFREALDYAQLKNWLPVLIDSIVASGLEDGRIAADLSHAAPDAAPLQAMINKAAGFMLPQVVMKGLDQGTRWTGKILIDGQPSGTGLLIANNRMLTAWHVVKALFQPDQSGEYTPDSDPATGDRLEVVFSDFMDRLGRGAKLLGRGERRVKGHSNWCVSFSNCHDAELRSEMPQNLEELDGKWDYAIIRLAEPIGFERGWATPDDRAFVPSPDDKMLLLQHPAGQPMRLDVENIAAPSDQQKSVIPRLRFLHLLNALAGSSGGPCFDRTLSFFGFHQGVWNGSTPKTNRGVPIVRVLEDLKTKYGVTKLESEDSLIWKLGADKNDAPVIGCEAFQSQVLDASIPGKPRIFTIRGNKGVGKTFHANLVAALLPDAAHLKIELPAQAIATKEATELAKFICSKAGAGTLELEPVSEVFSTAAVWLKDEVTRKLIEAIDSVRNGRSVWLLITQLNHFDIKGEHATQLLLLIYEHVKTSPWLRIVLDGLKTDIPGGMAEHEFRYRVGEITRPQIDTYLQRLGTYFNLNLGTWTLGEAIRLFKKYETELNNNPDNAAQLLIDTIMNETWQVYDALNNGT